MNIHHLELFFHVATHGGISKAVRHMPYGIQQPAVSSQVLQLEEQLGVKLFERTPFKLTPSGEELFRSIQPFFSGLDALAERVSKSHRPRLRIGAAEIVLSDYLPPILAQLRKLHPEFRLGLQAKGAAEIEAAFANQEIDLAISPIDARLSPRLQREKLVSVPLTLLVPATSPWRTSADIFATAQTRQQKARSTESPDITLQPLIGLPPSERVMALFQEELTRRGLSWPIAIETSSLSLVEKYVQNGYGVGLSVATDSAPATFPRVNRRPRQVRSQSNEGSVRAIALNDFPALEIFLIWPRERSALVKTLHEEIRRALGA